MRRIILVLSVAALMVAMLAPSVIAKPTKPVNENFGGNENSALNRNDNSGKGNFGQCQRLSGGELEASEFNPSSQNTGEADCRQAGGSSAQSVAQCEEPLVPGAESQLTFGENRGASAHGRCT